MENYQKGKNIEEPFERENVPDFVGKPDDFFWMKVTGSSKIRNLLEVALRKFEAKRHVIWSASGPAITKAISCAELMKKRSKSQPHQVTKICYRRVDETWDPLLEELSPIVVRREIPCIHIFLSIDPIDTNQSGYQPPGPYWRNQEQSQTNPKKSSISEEKMENLGLRTGGKKKKKSPHTKMDQNKQN